MAMRSEGVALNLAAALPTGSPPAAQEPPQRTFVAIGPALAPDHLGSSDYEAVPLILGTVELGPTHLEIEGLGLRLDLSPLLFELPSLDYGPALRCQRGALDHTVSGGAWRRPFSASSTRPATGSKALDVAPAMASLHGARRARGRRGETCRGARTA